MQHSTFYPGPSKIYPQVEGFLAEAFASGILSANHRSTMGMDLIKSCVEIVKSKLDIPSDYEVFLTSSATECWEIIAQSLILNSSQHLHNGAFGQKWAAYTQRLCKNSEAIDFEDINQKIYIENSTSDLLCITQNETANGSWIDMETMGQIREKHQGIIAVDVTSSLGGIALDWPLGDVWFGSVQKCLGLPAGLALMVCSPRAIAQAKVINNRQHYNSLLFVKENFDVHQTPYTPNMLGIFLLKKVMEIRQPIAQINKHISLRAKGLYRFFEENHQIGLWPLVDTQGLRSATVICLGGEPERINFLIEKCLSQGIILGKGYGHLKQNSLRIANFPAIDDTEFERLKHLLMNS